MKRCEPVRHHVMSPLRLAAFITMCVGCREATPALEVWTPSDHQQPAEDLPTPGRAAPDESARDETEPSAAAPDAAALYATHCANCHGPSGAGGAMPDGMTAPDLHVSTLEPAAVAVLLVQGRGAMPGFGDRLSAAEIAALVPFVAAWRGEEPSTR